MRQYIEVRGYRIAVHAVSGAQLNWYRDNYALLSDADLAIRALETTLDDHKRNQDGAQAQRAHAAVAKRRLFHIV